MADDGSPSMEDAIFPVGGSIGPLLAAYDAKRLSFYQAIALARQNCLDTVKLDSFKQSSLFDVKSGRAAFGADLRRLIQVLENGATDMSKLCLALALCLTRISIEKSRESRYMEDGLSFLEPNILYSLACVAEKRLQALYDSFLSAEGSTATESAGAASVALLTCSELCVELVQLILQFNSRIPVQSGEHSLEKHLTQTVSALRKLGPNLITRVCAVARLFYSRRTRSAVSLEGTAVLGRLLASLICNPILSLPQLQRSVGVLELFWDLCTSCDSFPSEFLLKARLVVCRYAATVPGEWYGLCTRLCKDLTGVLEKSSISEDLRAIQLAATQIVRMLELLHDLLEYMSGSPGAKAFGNVPLGDHAVSGPVPLSQILDLVHQIYARTLAQAAATAKQYLEKAEGNTAMEEEQDESKIEQSDLIEFAQIAEEDTLTAAARVFQVLISIVPAADLLIRSKTLRDLLGLFLIPKADSHLDQACRAAILIRYHSYFLILVDLIACKLRGAFLLDARQLEIMLESTLFALVIYFPPSAQGPVTKSLRLELARFLLNSKLYNLRKGRRPKVSALFMVSGIPPAPASFLQVLSIIEQKYSHYLDARRRAKIDELAVRFAYLATTTSKFAQEDLATTFHVPDQFLDSALSTSLAQHLQRADLVRGILDLFESGLLSGESHSAYYQASLAILEKLRVRLLAAHRTPTDMSLEEATALAERIPPITLQLRLRLQRVQGETGSVPAHEWSSQATVLQRYEEAFKGSLGELELVQSEFSAVLEDLQSVEGALELKKEEYAALSQSVAALHAAVPTREEATLLQQFLSDPEGHQLAALQGTVPNMTPPAPGPDGGAGPGPVVGPVPGPVPLQDQYRHEERGSDSTSGNGIEDDEESPASGEDDEDESGESSASARSDLEREAWPVERQKSSEYFERGSEGSGDSNDFSGDSRSSPAEWPASGMAAVESVDLDDDSPSGSEAPPVPAGPPSPPEVGEVEAGDAEDKVGVVDGGPGEVDAGPGEAHDASPGEAHDAGPGEAHDAGPEDGVATEVTPDEVNATAAANATHEEADGPHGETVALGKVDTAPGPIGSSEEHESSVPQVDMQIENGEVSAEPEISQQAADMRDGSPDGGDSSAASSVEDDDDDDALLDRLL